MLERVVRAAPALTVRLALEHVRSLKGAINIYEAERGGRNRPDVLRAAARRIEQLGGAEPLRTSPILNVVGEAVDQKTIIVEAVGRGKRHPGW